MPHPPTIPPLQHIVEKTQWRKSEKMDVVDKSTNPKTLGRVTFNEAGSISPGPILKGNVALLYNQLCCKSKSVQPTRHSHINDGQDSNKCVANDNNQCQLSHNNVALFLFVLHFARNNMAVVCSLQNDGPVSEGSREQNQRRTSERELKRM